MAYTEQQLNQIAQVQEQRSLTRKSAVQFCARLWRKEAAAKAQPVAAPAPKAAAQPEERRKPKKAKPAASDSTRLGPPTPEEAKQIVKLYAKGTGMSVPDLAEKFGRRDKGNRIRRVLVAAGVYEGVCGKYYGGTA